jgi:hypothetical protein
MNEQQIKSLVKILGISASVLSGVIVVGFGFYLYRNFIELEKSKLQIKVLKRDLGITPASA